MQRDLIHRLAADVARVCRGRTWERALPRPGEGLALLPAEPGEPALDLSPLPPQGWIAATTVRLKADPAPGGAGRAALGRELAGRSLLAVAMLAGDRVVRLTLDDGRALLVELLGAAAGMLANHAEGIDADETECERQFNSSVEIVTAFLPVVGYDRATELVEAFKKTGRTDFATYLVEELGAAVVEKTLSPQNLMALGHRT